MSISFACPNCDKDYTVEDGLAGLYVRCKECDHKLKIPNVLAAEETTSLAAGLAGKIEFRCACGKKYVTPANLAGKKVRCKGCGQGVRVPGKAVAPDPLSSGAGPAAAPELDLYDLEEGPTAPPPRSVSDDGLVPVRRGASIGVPPPLPRAGASTLTAAEKEKIRKRAAKRDKEKSSFAGVSMGVSFGTVLMVALIGWRFYRVAHRMERIADAVTADSPVDRTSDPVADATAVDRDLEKSIADPASAEAREWLDPKHANHVIFEWGNERAREMVEGFYHRGAEKVYVLEPSPFGKNLVTASFAVKLPVDPANRKECFAWESKIAGEEGTDADVGQKYIAVSVD